MKSTISAVTWAALAVAALMSPWAVQAADAAKPSASAAQGKVPKAATTAKAAKAGKAPVTQVIGWVPAYGVSQSLAAINSNPLIAKGLTRIGLQLWNPTPDGKGLVYAPMDEHGNSFNPRHIALLRDWGHANGIQVLLTVYNNSQVLQKWDWALARNAFAGHRSEFVKALLDAVDQHGLDGVDLDLEGEGSLDADRAAYAAFVRELSAALHAKGKLLTVDTFHSPCANAPNMSWWADWVGQIDALHSMGYQDLYEGSTETFNPGGVACAGGAALFRYSWQLEYGVKAGYKRQQVVLGMPTWLGDWGKAGTTGKGTSTVDHLREAKALGAGIALWDLQLTAPAWRSDDTWRAVAHLRKP